LKLERRVHPFAIVPDEDSVPFHDKALHKAIVIQMIGLGLVDDRPPLFIHMDGDVTSPQPEEPCRRILSVLDGVTGFGAPGTA
jgi:hypothetical protein